MVRLKETLRAPSSTCRRSLTLKLFQTVGALVLLATQACTGAQTRAPGATAPARDERPRAAEVQNHVEANKKLATAAQKNFDGDARPPSHLAPSGHGFYREAARTFRQAQSMPDGPQRDALWKRAAELYEGALNAGPGRKEAPEAAILGAQAHKMIGGYDKAIAMYELFIRAYGSEDSLARLKNGDAKNRVPPQPAEYRERVKFLKVAYDALAEANILFFSYAQAAHLYERMAGVHHFESGHRRVAAYNATFLFGAIGDDKHVTKNKTRFLHLNPTSRGMAEMGWMLAKLELTHWDALRPDEGSNRAARRVATRALRGYHRTFVRTRAASAFVVKAAYHLAKMSRAAKEPSADRWCRRTVAAFDRFKASGLAGINESGRSLALGSVQADMAAECAYRAIDADLNKTFDHASGHHRYKGRAADIRIDFKRDVEVGAKRHHDRLQHVIDKYLSRRWSVAARVRQGSLYASCRTGLLETREPAVKLYTPKEVRRLKQLDALCATNNAAAACTKSEAFKAKRHATWKQSIASDVALAERMMVRMYATAMMWARAWRIRHASVDVAIARLSSITLRMGDAKLRGHLQGLVAPATRAPLNYSDGMFVRMRRGLAAETSDTLLLPAQPARLEW